MAVTTARRGAPKARRSSATHTAVRTYQRNALSANLRRWLLWLLLNFRYAFVWIISLGGNLERLPKRSELPLVAGLVFAWAILSTGGLIVGSYGLMFVPAMVVTLTCFIGSYYLIMEYTGGEQLVGIALAVDIIFLPSTKLSMTIKLLVFSFFLLVCVRDWRRIVSLPERPTQKR